MTHASTTQAASDAIETRDAWNDIATGYDRFVTPTHFWLGTEALRRVKLSAGLNRLRLPPLPSGTYRLVLGGRKAILVI